MKPDAPGGDILPDGPPPDATDARRWGGRWLNVRLPLALRDVAALVFLPLIVAVVAIDVFTRYVMNRPLQWSQEIASLALLLLFVAAIPFATASGGHIRTETLYERYGPRMRHLVDAFGCLFGAVFTGVISFWQFRELPGLARRGEGAEFVDLPYWPISLLVAICMGFSALQLVVRMAEHAAWALRGKEGS